MSPRQIVKLSDLRASAEQAAEQALRTGSTEEDCPDEYAEFAEEWQQAFRKAKFDRACFDQEQK